MMPMYLATATSGLEAPRERIQRSSIASGETASTPASAMRTPRGLDTSLLMLIARPSRDRRSKFGSTKRSGHFGRASEAMEF
eukprot:scaffold13600_cov59-Phaeocystis_antarctica.AAC.2